MFGDCCDLIACKYVLVTDTRLCHLLILSSGKAKNWMQLPFAICLEASHYAMFELGLPNAGLYYAKLTAQGFFTWGKMPLKTCVNVIFKGRVIRCLFVIFSKISPDLIQNHVKLKFLVRWASL